MLFLIQRVTAASVTVESLGYHEKISSGACVLIGIHKDDDQPDFDYCCSRLLQLEMFGQNHLDQNIIQAEGELLLIPQFTLCGSTKKARPSFSNAMAANLAKDVFANICDHLAKDVIVKQGVFGAYMQVSITNDGPVTFIIDSKNR